MITLEGMKFMLFVGMPILFVAMMGCGYIFIKFSDKKPILSAIAIGAIVVGSMYVIYFLRYYFADLGWFPPVSSNEMNNLTMGLI